MNHLMIAAIAAYTLVHGGIYLWYQSHRDERGEDATTSQTDRTETGAARQRRVASGIHGSQARTRRLISVAMALAAMVLAGLAIASLAGQTT